MLSACGHILHDLSSHKVDIDIIHKSPLSVESVISDNPSFFTVGGNQGEQRRPTVLRQVERKALCWQQALFCAPSHSFHHRGNSVCDQRAFLKNCSQTGEDMTPNNEHCDRPANLCIYEFTIATKSECGSCAQVPRVIFCGNNGIDSTDVS